MKPALIGREIIHYSALDSTNDQAQKLIAKSNPIEGTVISADFQWAGKGQRNHNWQSEAGKNLLLTIILYPGFLDSEKQFLLSMCGTVAICSMLTTYLPSKKLRIKWPNDIYYDDRKIAGLLIRNLLKGSRISSSLIGIGLNVNQEEFPPALPNPVSMYQITGQMTELKSIRSRLLDSFQSQYELLMSADFASLKKSYLALLYKLGEKTLVHASGKSIEGTILGVWDDGRIIMHVDGQVVKLRH